MDKKTTSLGTHASVLFTYNRRVFWAHFSLLVFLSLSITNLQSGASARAAVDEPSRQDKASVTSYQSQPSAHVADQILLKVKTSARGPRARISARNCPACQQALVECLGNGGSGDCFVQYYACIASCQ